MGLFKIRPCDKCGADDWRENAVAREQHGDEVTTDASYSCIHCGHMLRRVTVRLLRVVQGRKA